MSHSYRYKVSGEDLPSRHQNRIAYKLTFTGFFWLLFCFIFGRIGELLTRFFYFFKNIFSTTSAGGSFNLLEGFSNVEKLDMTGIWNPLESLTPLWARLLFYIVAAILAAYCGFKLDMYIRPLADGQKGDMRLATLKEIQKTFKEIPEVSESFEGIGGIPITHYEDKWYIETDTVNTCIVGTSRSGKGQTTVLSTIDNLSRAEEQCSMVVNDPKTELYVASKDELELRGYDVFAYNITDPLQSMSDNPLELIKKYWQRGDIDTATELANTFTSTIYNDPNAGDNKYFNENAQKAVNALIFAILDQADKSGNYEEYDKLTPNNIVELLSEIGGFNYTTPDDEFNQKNALDEFMSQLPPDNVAKKQYGATKIGSEKAKGNILSTAITGLNPYTLPKIAKMSTTSTIDYKSVGFPKYIDLKVSKDLLNKRLDVVFYRGDKKLKSERVKVGYRGFCELNFDCDLKDGDVVEISYTFKERVFKKQYSFQRVPLRDQKNRIIYQKKRGNEHLPEWDKNIRLTEIPSKGVQGLIVENIKMYYSDKPMAIFMLTPDYNKSNHVIVSIFLKQLYTELSTQCVKTKGDKCHRRIHYLLDEFGNMPAIDDMPGVMTVTAGRNMLWDLFVQSYAQIFSKFGEEDGTTIKENCQTHIYIMSTNDDTIEEFSKKVGNQTVEQEMGQVDAFGGNKSINRNPDQERILTTERISTFLEGETIVLRNLKRRDKDRLKVRPFPIFNTQETASPYAYEYLKEFNPSWDMNDIDIYCTHANLDLKEYQLDYDYYLVNDYAKRLYHKQQEQYKELAEEESSQAITFMELVRERVHNEQFILSIQRMYDAEAFEKIIQKINDEQEYLDQVTKKILISAFVSEMNAKNIAV